MIEILPTENDDKNFIGLIEQILRAEVCFDQPEAVFITKVDHWFDFKWRGFSHKIFGELGVWHNHLRIPPFIPDRIIEESYFEKVEENYIYKDLFQLHIYQPSSKNATRKMKRDSAVYFWFSGDTLNHTQGSLMVYKFGKDSQNSWYASFIKKSKWQIYKTDNISNAEVKALIENNHIALVQ